MVYANFRVNTNHLFISKIHYARKNKYELLKDNKSKVYRIQRAHIPYKIHSKVVLAFFKSNFKA